MFEKIALIGIGLIGSSIARAITRGKLAGAISIFDKNADALAEAEKLGLGTEYHKSAQDAVKGADLVVLCTPVGTFETVGKQISHHLEPGCIVTDVGSVKRSVIDQLKPNLPAHVHLIPGHPIAGTEYSGPDAGFSTLFDDRWILLTPEPDVDSSAIEKLSDFWKGLGSEIDIMDADHHDRVLAVTSRIPHLIAYNIVGTASDLEEISESEVIKFSASGFRDFTRIAASDPVMWRDVFLHNKSAVLEMLGRFSEDLSRLQRAVRWGDGELLFDHFTKTRAIRRGIIEAGQETDKPNFGRDVSEDN